MKKWKQKILLCTLVAGVGLSGFSAAKIEKSSNLEQIAASAEEFSPPGVNQRSVLNKPNQEAELRIISGYIKSIDEDSLPVISSGWAEIYNNETKKAEYQFLTETGEFQFEHMRIYSEADKKVYNMIFPGPSNYQVGDHVTFKYEPRTILSFKELVGSYAIGIGENPIMSPLQRGYFNIDGLIKRQGEGW